MTIYSLDVVRSYWQKIQDGTLWTLARLRTTGHARQSLCQTEPTGFIHILPKVTRTKGLGDFLTLTRDEARWEAFAQTRLEPCFLYEVDFHPFETPVCESAAHASDPFDGPDKDGPATAETSVSPAQVIELSLAKIEHRFPGGDGAAEDESHGLADWGDSDIRDLIATQTFVFHNNYDALNRRRRANVQMWMRLALAVIALWIVWGLESLSTGGVRPLHVAVSSMLAYADIDPARSRLVIRALCTPWPFLAVTFGLFAAALAWADHIHGLQRLRFVGSTRSSSATVSKSVTSRLESLLYVTRALIEEIDRGKDDAWDQGTLKPWAADTQKLVSLVFWCDQRIYAIEETLRMHMKLVGLCNDGVREDGKFRALLLVYRHAALACLLPVLTWLGGASLLGWRIDAFDVQSAICLLICTLAFFALLLRLHALVKAHEPPESVYNLISYAATQTMKGYRDSQLYKEIAAFVTREKRRLLREEEKRRV